VRETPDEASVLLVIGHNPTIAVVAQLLDDGSGDEAADQEMTAGFPTSALAVFEYDGAWADLQPASARLTAFHSPR
jgi:phosphohistidine phosphatase